MKRLSFGAAIACALFALAFLQNAARADHGGHGENCENWREPSQTVIHFRHNGIPERHVRIVISKVLDLPAPVQARVSRIIDEAYKWRGEMEFGQYIVDLCGKAWISDEEAAPAEPESRVPSPESRVLLVKVKGQPMACRNRLPFAAQIERDLTMRNIQLSQLSFASQEDERTAADSRALRPQSYA
jgi:hypothetical protein